MRSDLKAMLPMKIKPFAEVLEATNNMALACEAIGETATPKALNRLRSAYPVLGAIISEFDADIRQQIIWSQTDTCLLLMEEYGKLEEPEERIKALRTYSQVAGFNKAEAPVINVNQTQQQAIQIVMPDTHPADPEHQQEVDRLKRAIPAANIQVQDVTSERLPAKPTQEDIQQRLHALHVEHELQDIL